MRSSFHGRAQVVPRAMVGAVLSWLDVCKNDVFGTKSFPCHHVVLRIMWFFSNPVFLRITSIEERLCPGRWLSRAQLLNERDMLHMVYSEAFFFISRCVCVCVHVCALYILVALTVDAKMSRYLLRALDSRG